MDSNKMNELVQSAYQKLGMVQEEGDAVMALWAEIREFQGEEEELNTLQNAALDRADDCKTALDEAWTDIRLLSSVVLWTGEGNAVMTNLFKRYSEGSAKVYQVWKALGEMFPTVKKELEEGQEELKPSGLPS